MRVAATLAAAAWLAAAWAVDRANDPPVDFGGGVIAWCYRSEGAAAAIFLVAGLGAFALALEPVVFSRRPGARTLAVASLLFVAWALLAFAWFPHLDRICEN